MSTMDEPTRDDPDQDASITVGETVDGATYRLPVEDLLTGRLFCTGKSGAGKSNSGSVIVEELLERGHPVLIVDVDGEYWGLKEEYEILHVGATEDCDLQVGPEHASKIAELSLEENIPIVLDVSGYVDADEADDLVREVAHELFVREHDLRKPFLMLVEEIHEYIPQQGGLDETGEMLIRVAKRGRKRGLGLAGLSQRPAAVDKDFITQADLVIWHRLTWENDTKVVKQILGADYADQISSLADGEAFVQADWFEADVQRVQFRRKRTFDAGAAPGLDDVERPELKSIGEGLVDELQEISDRHERRQDRIAELETQLEVKEEEIAELEEDLEDAQDLQRLGEAFVNAAQDQGGADIEAEQQELLEEKNETIADLRDRVDDLEASLEDVQADRDELASEVERLRGVEERVEQAEQIEEQLDRAREVLGVEVEASAAAVEGDVDEEVATLRAELANAQERINDLEVENERLREDGARVSTAEEELVRLVHHDAIQSAVDVAKRDTDRADKHFDRVLNILANADGGPLSAEEIVPLMDDISKTTANMVLKALFETGVLKREKDGRSSVYELDLEFLERRVEVADQQAQYSS